MNVAFYLRVSTRNGQTTENQRRELEAVAAQRGWRIVDVYEDAGISGAKGRDQRPALDRMLRDVTRGRANLVAAWSVDRLGRSLQALVGLLAELQAAGCELYLHQQAVDTTTPSGRALFQMLGVFAEFERAMIRERVAAGLARARASGRRLGRPKTKGQPRQGMRRTGLLGGRAGHSQSGARARRRRIGGAADQARVGGHGVERARPWPRSSRADDGDRSLG